MASDGRTTGRKDEAQPGPWPIVAPEPPSSLGTATTDDFETSGGWQLASEASPLGQDVPHESAVLHVTGRARYLADFLPLRDELIVGFVGSPLAHARIKHIDVEKARGTDGVLAAFTHADVPGSNRFGAELPDEEVLAEQECRYVGQPIVVLAAESFQALREGQAAVRLELEELSAVFCIDDAIKREDFLGSARRLGRGDVEVVFASAPHVLEGTFRIGGQEHFYLESQGALAIPGDGGRMTIYSSTQHPGEVQELVARCLGLPYSQVVCSCERLGGAFGGKESQAGHPAMLAALVAFRTGRPARLVYSKDLDMRVTGKRHPFQAQYKVGFTSEGQITALKMDLYADGGAAADLGLGVVKRAMFHAENAYFIPAIAVTGTLCRTNLPPNTAMRGFGASQAVAAMENVIEEVAAFLKRDALEIRRINCYGVHERNITPYGQVVLDNTLPVLLDRLAESSDYPNRREQVKTFNEQSRTHLKGLSLIAVKFGVSFSKQEMNQGNALVHLYRDGTVQVSTGGVEMGQGLHTKIRQLVAHQFALPLDSVRVMPTSTEKNNNCSATAASSGTDLNGTAAVRACQVLRERLLEAAARYLADPAKGMKASPGDIRFVQGGVVDVRQPGRRLGFAELVERAYRDRVDLGARGFYATPGISFNKETGQGHPFFYFTNGCAAAEVLIDRFTGALKVLRVDVLMDIGKSINPAIDRGQVVGGFVQGMGWVTREKLRYSEQGELLTHSPNTYRIPNIESLPEEFRVAFLDNPMNRRNLYSTKAVGEPPLLLGISVWTAVKQALSFLEPGTVPALDLPASGDELIRRLHPSRSARP